MRLTLEIVQIIFDHYDVPISGGDLRNDMIKRCLEELGNVRQIATATSVVASDFVGRVASDRSGRTPAPDLIVAEGVLLLDHALALRAAYPAARVVCDFHNVESLLLREQHHASMPRLARGLAPLFHRRAWHAAEALDRRAIAQCDAIWTTSQIDADRTRALAGEGTCVEVIPNAVPSRPSTPSQPFPGGPLTAPQLLFLGHLNYPPNIEAVCRLARTVMPRIVRGVPQAHLVVAGRSPNERVTRALRRARNISLVPDPVDVMPLYAAADLVVVPLAEGGGSRIKILEALFLGVPVIASSKAVEGLEITDRTHFILANDAAEIARSVRDLACDPALRQRLSEAGRRFVVAHHTGPALRKAVARAVAELSSR